MAEGLRDALVSIELGLQSMNDLDIRLRSSQLLLLNCRMAYHFLFVDCCFNVFIQHRFQDTTTFKVNVTASDLENSFIFDNEA